MGAVPEQILVCLIWSPPDVKRRQRIFRQTATVVPPTSRLMIDKKDLRAALRSRRDAFVAALDDDGRQSAVQALAQRLDAVLARATCVAGYMPLGSEFPVHAVLERAAALGCATALPVVEGRDRAMHFSPWRPGDPLTRGWAGLSQPDPSRIVAPDLILTPLLGFDRALGRLGQGAGFYDRYFPKAPDARRIGIAWACQEVDEIPIDPWDVPLHAIVTEMDWIGPTS
jgi:5-formyltetrahydrofolate cyclo-ligase